VSCPTRYDGGRADRGECSPMGARVTTCCAARDALFLCTALRLQQQCAVVYKTISVLSRVHARVRVRVVEPYALSTLELGIGPCCTGRAMLQRVAVISFQAIRVLRSHMACRVPRHPNFHERAMCSNESLCVLFCEQFIPCLTYMGSRKRASSKRQGPPVGICRVAPNRQTEQQQHVLSLLRG
jgi:hypothetical protein